MILNKHEGSVIGTVNTIMVSGEFNPIDFGCTFNDTKSALNIFLAVSAHVRRVQADSGVVV